MTNVGQGSRHLGEVDIRDQRNFENSICKAEPRSESEELPCHNYTSVCI